MDANRLQSLPPFSWLPDEVRQRFSVWVVEVKVDAGKHLAEQGDWAYELFSIEDGQAEVQRDGQKIADLGPGDFFGEMGLLEKTLRNATVTAKAPMKLITLTGWDMKRMERHIPEATERVRATLEERRPS